MCLRDVKIIFLFWAVTICACEADNDRQAVNAISSSGFLPASLAEAQNLKVAFGFIEVSEQLVVDGSSIFNESVVFNAPITVSGGIISGGSGTQLTGSVLINATGTGTTQIGNPLSTTTIVGPIRINEAPSASTTTIGNAQFSGPFTVDSGNSLVSINTLSTDTCGVCIGNTIASQIQLSSGSGDIMVASGPGNVVVSSGSGNLNLNTNNETGLITIGNTDGPSSVFFPGPVTFASTPGSIGGQTSTGQINFNASTTGTTTIGNNAVNPNGPSTTLIKGVIQIDSGANPLMINTLTTDIGGVVIGNSTGGTTTINGTIVLAGLSEPAGVGCNIVPVVVDSAGNLWKAGTANGTCISSRRYKTDIQRLQPEDTAALMDLEPCRFRPKDSPFAPEEFGLVAEALLEKGIFLNALYYDRDGKVDAVRYETILMALLNEFIRFRKEYNDLVIKHEALCVSVQSLLDI